MEGKMKKRKKKKMKEVQWTAYWTTIINFLERLGLKLNPHFPTKKEILQNILGKISWETKMDLKNACLMLSNTAPKGEKRKIKFAKMLLKCL
jgi:hypothetical protein